MEFKSCTSKYNVGDILVHKYFVPGSDEPRYEDLKITSVSLTYGIKCSGDKRPSLFIEYYCVNAAGGNCSHGIGFHFIEDDWRDIKSLTLKSE